MGVFCEECSGECLAATASLVSLPPAHLASVPALELVLGRSPLSFSDCNAVNTAVYSALRNSPSSQWPSLEESLAVGVAVLQQAELSGSISADFAAKVLARWIGAATRLFRQYNSLASGPASPPSVLASAIAGDPCVRSDADGDARWFAVVGDLPWTLGQIYSAGAASLFVSSLGIAFGRCSSPAALGRTLSMYSAKKFPLSYALAATSQRHEDQVSKLVKSIAGLSNSGREFVAAHASSWEFSAESLVSAAASATAPRRALPVGDPAPPVGLSAGL